MERFNYNEAKTETEAKKLARIDLTNLFLKFLKETFGEENVGLVDKNTIGFAFADVKDKDGYPCDMVATIKPTIKNYQDHNGEKRQTEAFDLGQAIEDYKVGLGES